MEAVASKIAGGFEVEEEVGKSCGGWSTCKKEDHHSTVFAGCSGQWLQGRMEHTRRQLCGYRREPWGELLLGREIESTRGI